jgi:hypothetical protein
MARGFGAGANQVVQADSGKSQEPSKKVIEGNDLRSGKK